MKIFAAITLAALMVFSIGCSNDESASPGNAEPMSYYVIGDDTPETMESAMLELSELSLTIPDPVLSDDPALTRELDMAAAAAVIADARLDDEARMHFRRIVGHLHDRLQMLRRCMNENPDPRLRRLAYGAFHATQRGLRLIEAGEPRHALRAFHRANRVLNFALRVCLNDDDRPGRP